MDNFDSHRTNTSTPDDSGLWESSTNDTNFTDTPTTTSLITSRKRKLEFQPSCSAWGRLTTSIDSPALSPWIANPEILSSTLNDSIATGVENCKIENSPSAFEDSSANETSFLKKGLRTPIKCSNNCYNTKSSPRHSPLHKLGSPERTDILYCTLPQKPKNGDSKRYSPAKKRLFKTDKPVRKDPIALFCKEKEVSHVMRKVFLCLSAEDLYSCTKVSKLWKREINKYKDLKSVVKFFVNDKVMNKENLPKVQHPSTSSSSENAQPTHNDDPITNIYELTKILSDTQHLQQCLSCGKPEAVVDKNISQCTSIHCGVIRCLKCDSFSVTGPSNFVDKCRESYLHIEKPPEPKYSLLFSPVRNHRESVPSGLLSNSSLHTENSSGYFTESDLSISHRHSTSLTRERSDRSQVLKTNNIRVETKPKTYPVRRNTVLPVISLEKKFEEVTAEPPSPPRIFACSKKSKKMLKRLVL